MVRRVVRSRCSLGIAGAAIRCVYVFKHHHGHLGIISALTRKKIAQRGRARSVPTARTSASARDWSLSRRKHLTWSQSRDGPTSKGDRRASRLTQSV